MTWVFPNAGPIPRGRWEITGGPFVHPRAGRYTLRLAPMPETDTFGRSGFLIHGDSVSSPGNASTGCIILDLTYREEIWISGDRDLEVVE